MRYTLEGIDGNAYCLMAYARMAMMRERFPYEAIEEYEHAAMSSDYDNLVSVTWEQVEDVNSFVEFWEDYQREYGHITVSKKVAAKFFFEQGNNIDEFRDYVLSNDLIEELVK